jgi:cysteine-rich repeat protein
MTIARRFTIWVALACMPALPSPVAESATLENGSWSIELSDFAYSDGMFSPKGHEQLSGEWAAAVRYDGVSGGESMWLEPNWSAPDWTSNSQFGVVKPLEAWNDPENPIAAFDTGRGVVANGQVEITIDVSMRDGVTAMGLSSNAAVQSLVRSYRYVLLSTYAIRNVSPSPLSNVAFYQMMHAHPNDSFGADNYGVYDSHAYSDAADAFPEYRYDMTFFAPKERWREDLDDVIGFSAAQAPAAVQIGSFRTPADEGEPGPGSLHHVVEADALNGVAVGGPDEIAGAMKWSLGTLHPGQAAVLTILLSTSHSLSGIDPPQPLPVCGNGVVEAGEGCDDGNVSDGDCCSSRCVIQPDGAPCGGGGGARCGTDVCVAGICSDHPVCGQVIVQDPPRAKAPPIKVTCSGDGPAAKGDFCEAQAFAPASGLEALAAVETAYVHPQAAGEVAITRKVKKPLKPKTGTARLTLRLNKIGKQLLRAATRRGEPLNARVEVTVSRARQPTLLSMLVRLFGKLRRS